MPVIGRLDGQVEEVIIKPIAERRPQEGTTSPDAEKAPEPPLPPERAPVQTPHPHESSAEADELPVWLL